MNQQIEKAKKMGQLIAKCWQDEALKAKLIANPAAVLKEFGLEAIIHLSFLSVFYVRKLSV